jgi:hypothetical protein
MRTQKMAEDAETAVAEATRTAVAADAETAMAEAA